MHIIIRTLVALAFCLFGMSAEAMEYTAKVGDTATRLAEATGQSLDELIRANKGKITAPLFWLYTKEQYEVPSLPALAKAVAGKEVAVVSTQQTARAAREEAKTHTLEEALLITQRVVEGAVVSPAAVRETVAIAANPAIVVVRPTRKQKRVVHSTPIVNEVAEEVPNFDAVCTDCTFDAFIAKTNFPADVTRALSDKVANEEFAATVVSSGEEFALMQFANGTLWQNVTARWRDEQHEVHAREYVLRTHGMVYAIVFWSDTGNWSSRTSSPDPLVLLSIKQSLEDIVRPKCELEQLPRSTCDVMPLVNLIWRVKFRSTNPMTLAIKEGSVYAGLPEFIDQFPVPGVPQQEAIPITLSLNQK